MEFFCKRVSIARLQPDAGRGLCMKTLFFKNEMTLPVISSLVVFLLLNVCSFYCCSLLFCPTKSVFLRKAIGCITVAKGAVFVSSIQHSLTRLKQGDEIHNNDIIKTGNRSIARIEMPGIYSADIAEKSVVVFKTVQGAMYVHVQAGNVLLRTGDGIVYRVHGACIARVTAKRTVVIKEQPSSLCNYK